MSATPLRIRQNVFIYFNIPLTSLSKETCYVMLTYDFGINCTPLRCIASVFAVLRSYRTSATANMIKRVRNVNLRSII